MMQDALLLFQFIKDRRVPGEFFDVSDFLTGLEYSDHGKKYEFLQMLRTRGFIEINDPPLAVWSSYGKIGSRTDDTQKYMVRLTLEGDQYLSDNYRSESNVLSNKRIAGGTIGAMVVAGFGLLFGLYQYYQSSEKESIIEHQKIL